jgi:hypothetical protein
MVAVALDLGAPLVEDHALARGIVVVRAPARRLAPHEVAELVRPVEEARLEDLLVQPRAVEAGGHRELDVVLQRGVARRGPDAVGVEALVEEGWKTGCILRRRRASR